MNHRIYILIESYDDFGRRVEINKKLCVSMSDIEIKEWLKNHTIEKIDWSKHI